MHGYRSLLTALVLGGLALLSVSVRPASADPALVHFLGVTPVGPDFRFDYALELGPAESITAGSYFTIYDFTGLIPGSFTAPADWTGSSVPVGPTPPLIFPPDDPGTANITFTYNGPLTTNGGPLAGFSALSQYGATTAGMYTTATVDVLSGDPGRNGSVGPTLVPHIPEPGTLALLGGAGVVLGVIIPMRRRRRC